MYTIDGNRAIDRQVRRAMPIPLPKGPTTRDDDDTALHQWERPWTLTAPPSTKR
ncbi:hypothetical protein K443DRAFT_12915 [Laccaria amethystina LaAM-08-1]|uniref:Uncharacterized protein n=1 Tax=Laccaria amethystina LaAM-08-1 TaxID=1095629 RepID=A0A0C9X6U7_9AGAR|nr:hypothetical protein K443DRAFT_12915 [Laccaria amethystina LaAM-08-1]